MKITLDQSRPFDLDFTLCCGQAFRWHKRAEWWFGVVAGKVLKVRQVVDGLEFENVDACFVEKYLGLRDDLSKIMAQISKDEYMKKAAKTFKGLRILCQDPWECLISYICATCKNIEAIKLLILNLSKRFGDRIESEESDYFAFPTAERLARASITDLAACGLGYRAKYVYETVRAIQKSGFELECLRKMGYEDAKSQLMSFPGVGPKVADCVLLFSLEKLSAFPVDTWVRRIIIRHYPSHFSRDFVSRVASRKSLGIREYEKLSSFGRDYFGEYAGYAQEYLYHYERNER